MICISERPYLSLIYSDPQPLRDRIKLQIFSEPCRPELIVKQLASIEGPLDLYCWYEGPQGLPQSGARFMKEQVFKPLYQVKPDVKLCLYSLRAWDFKKNITILPSSTEMGEAINRLNKAAIECFYSSSFFQYCIQTPKESELYRYISEQLPKKEGLFRLSATHRKSGLTIRSFFNNRPSLFDFMEELDIVYAYSAMQYIEAYYLIQESVKKGLLKEQKKIAIALVLPNDESKYYLDLPRDIENMLRLDFGKALEGVEIYISFYFFKYGDSLNSRPYVDKRRKAPRVETEEIGSYFDYLSPDLSKISFLRDVLHNLNGWY